ncbi:MAG: hypothetical protein MRY49_02410 [Candidatus Pacebacteria bacterium]|nr:hypothetical protein [Candidatus Paceibacterota bacterium]
MARKDEVKYRITKVTGVVMIATAFVYDLWELVLDWLGNLLVAVFGAGLFFYAINLCGSIFIAFLFWTWFNIKGVPIFESPKKFLTSTIAGIGEQIPILDSIGFFGWTVGVILLVAISRSEDRGGIVGELGKSINPKKSVGKKLAKKGNG